LIGALEEDEDVDINDPVSVLKMIMVLIESES